MLQMACVKRWSKTFLLLLVLTACSKEKPLIDQQRFTRLLIDIHLTDGTLNANTERGMGVYPYYNWIYEKYGITHAEFDSCVRYYTQYPKLYALIYDSVIDSINKLLTVQNQILKELRVNDSVNLFPATDTLVFDMSRYEYRFELDSLLPGVYNFTTHLQFDTTERTLTHMLKSELISPQMKDTLIISNTSVRTDSVSRRYTWSQYTDSIYNKIIVTYRVKDYPKGKIHLTGWARNTTLYRPYLSRKREVQVKFAFEERKRREAERKAKEAEEKKRMEELRRKERQRVKKFQNKQADSVR